MQLLILVMSNFLYLYKIRDGEIGCLIYIIRYINYIYCEIVSVNVTAHFPWMVMITFLILIDVNKYIRYVMTL